LKKAAEKGYTNVGGGFEAGKDQGGDVGGIEKGEPSRKASLGEGRVWAEGEKRC